jgi:hypothetical protein
VNQAPRIAPSENGRIYLIKPRGSAWVVKVGYSANVGQRLAELQVGHHATLYVYAAFPGDRELERGLHDLLRPLNVRGEWFRDEGRGLKAFCEAVKCPFRRPHLLLIASVGEQAIASLKAIVGPEAPYSDFLFWISQPGNSTTVGKLIRSCSFARSEGRIVDPFITRKNP